MPSFRLRFSNSAQTAFAKSTRTAGSKPGGGFSGRSSVCGVADDLPREIECLVAGERWIVFLLAEVRQVQVVDDLGDDIVEALDQLHTGIGIAGHTKRFQHQLAELVCGGDGRRVEARQRVTQPQLALGQLVGLAVEQMLDHLVVPDERGVVERQQRLEDLAAHPLPQFLAGRPSERDEQHLVQGRDAFGDVAGHQTREGERLAGARTGFQHGRGPRGRQRAQQVEGWHVHQSGSLSADSIGSHNREA